MVAIPANHSMRFFRQISRKGGKTTMNKKVFAVVLTVLLLVTLCLGVYAASQIYTPEVTRANVTAKGSLYGHRIDNYIRIAASTTYASGPADYMVDVSTILYAKGTYTSSNSGIASNGVSAQSGQQVFDSSDNVASISSSHSATVYAASTTSIPLDNLSMNVDEID